MISDNIFSSIKQRSYWTLLRICDAIYRNFCFVPKILSNTECIKYINENRISLARIGDGELICMYGNDLNFQQSTPLLRKKLREVCESDNQYCMIGIPDVFEHLERYNKVEQNFWTWHFYSHRRKWFSFLKKDKVYANTFLSRFYSMNYNKDLSRSRIEMLKTLWHNRDVIMIEGADTKFGVGNDLFCNTKTIRRIIAPSKNAFGMYNELLDIATHIIDKNVLFIIALGPTATVLAYDLCNKGYQALDLGHMDIEYEWYKMGATSKVPIRGKFTNEAVIIKLANSEVVGELTDIDYEKQIISRIV